MMGLQNIIHCITVLTIIVFSVELDSISENKNIRKIGFGACNRRRFSFDSFVYFQNIINLNPDIWLWTGDIVYGKTKHGTDLTNIRHNYKHLKSHPLYQDFIASDVIIEGVYDDHDIGANDADNRLPKSIQKEAQNLLLDFLDVDTNNSRRQRDGVYSAHKYDDIMIIMLDTRTHRSPTAIIPSIGKYEIRFFPLIASYIRYLIAYFGFTDNYNGSVLDEKQWNWFEDILKSEEYKSSNLVLIVSSTQVFTSNPYFESWGHFPMEKIRLIKILNNSIDENEDKHVLFISGDVHHAELIYGNSEYGPLEITSSGLTHSILGFNRFFRKIATHIADTYKSYHRTKYIDENIKNVYYGRNFGMIEIRDEKKYKLNIYDAVSGEEIISVKLNDNKKSSIDKVMKELGTPNRIYFPVLYPFYGLEILLPVLLLIGMFILLFNWYFGTQKVKQH